MLIKCKLKRKGGTQIQLGNQTYHFKPADKALKPEDPAYMEADHVAEVTEPDHIHRLCAKIKEAYEPAEEGAVIPQPSKGAQQTMASDKKASDGQKVAAPVIIKDQNENEINLSDMDPADLRKLASEEFGIKVHNKWTDQVVIAKIVEKTRGED